MTDEKNKETREISVMDAVASSLVDLYDKKPFQVTFNIKLDKDEKVMLITFNNSKTLADNQ